MTEGEAARTTEDLVGRSVGGNRDAFAELVRRHERFVLGIAWNIAGDYHAAQDIAQEVFVTAFLRLSELRSPALFRPWIAQIAARATRRAKRRRPAHQPLDARTDIAATFGDVFTP